MPSILNAGRPGKRKLSNAFTLVELIVVITILAILATVGFIALSGYSQDAKDSAIKTNVRSLQTAISSESAIANNSPRYYVVHDASSFSAGSFTYVDGNPVVLTGGDVGAAPADSNFTSGNPDYKKLKLNPDKFRISDAGRFVPFMAANAATDSSAMLAGGIDASSTASNGRRRSVSYFQVAGINPVSKKAVVTGTFPALSASEIAAGAVSGLIKDPTSTSSGASLSDGQILGTSPVAQAAAAPTDPLAASVTHLLHFDGNARNEAGGATMTGVSVTYPSGAAKFGSGGLQFSGGASRVSVGSIPFGTGDFTVEGWAYSTGTTNTRILFANGHSWTNVGSYAMWLGAADTGGSADPTRIEFARHGKQYYSAAGAIPQNQWFHWAMSRISGTVYVFVDGQLVITAAEALDFTTPPTATLGAIVGNQNLSSQAWVGYIDDVRITVGTGRYSSNFSVPASAYPNP